nr:MAG TPA: hypothetical protein [Caudoviricetes sp.]DAR25180.1 MAG TPA: hypothetical protein [Caudoviricetes sp.]
MPDYLFIRDCKPLTDYIFFICFAAYDIFIIIAYNIYILNC